MPGTPTTWRCTRTSSTRSSTRSHQCHELLPRLLAIAPAAHHGEGANGVRQGKLRDTAFDHGPIAQLVVDRKGSLVQINEQARQLFRLGASDLGRPLRDLDISYRPVDLRSALDEVYEKRIPLRIADITWQSRPEKTLYLEILISPLFDETGVGLGAGIAFFDLTKAKLLQKELDRASQELETAYEELQSANEELETTNEELQSANEELETMNEELQSTNEELRTMNDQLHERSGELNEVNGLLESILGSLPFGVAVLDRDLAVGIWSARAEDLWGLRGAEVLGKPFLKLDIGIPVASLRRPLRDCLAGAAEVGAVTVDGVNRRGKPIHCQIVCKPLDPSDHGAGKVLVLMQESTRGEPASEPLSGSLEM